MSSLLFLFFVQKHLQILCFLLIFPVCTTLTRVLIPVLHRDLRRPMGTNPSQGLTLLKLQPLGTPSDAALLTFLPRWQNTHHDQGKAELRDLDKSLFQA